MDEVIVRLVPLPSSVEGFTIPDENGDYNVYLNDRMDDCRCRETVLHELDHIARGHFSDDVTAVKDKENEAKKRGASDCSEARATPD